MAENTKERLNAIKITVGKNLERIREEKGLIQSELADMIDYRHGAVSAWENGRNSTGKEPLSDNKSFSIYRPLNLKV
jgi:DNA-binding transcriptional regulator YiaG